MSDGAAAPKADTRIGDWMITYTGRRFWPLDPRPVEVDFRDIGHALSMLCRYGGHSRRFYSVAEHSCLLAGYFIRRGEPLKAKWSLLHDGSETYCIDIPRPLKPALDGYADIEAAIADAIYQRAGLEGEMPDDVKKADNAIIVDEALFLFGEERLRSAAWSVSKDDRLGVDIAGFDPRRAESEWLSLFNVLFGDPRQ